MDDSPTRLPQPSFLPKKDASKRRSLLLPPGTISGATARSKTAALSPAEEDAPAPRLQPHPQTNQRPVTMFGLQRPLQVTREESETEDTREDSRSPSPESKEVARASAHAALMGTGRPQEANAAASAPPKSGIARATSTRAPSARSVTSRAPETGRSRIAARPMSMLKESTSRPQSVASTASKTSTDAPPTSRLKAPVTSSSTIGLRRSNTTSTSTARHSRTQSAVPSSTATTSTSIHPTRRHPTISEGTPTAAPSSSAIAPSKLHRPAFSTLQQHYSPKKNLAPKPASATLIHAVAPDTAASSSSLETQLLQARLLQLSLLHRVAAPAYTAWTASARRALKAKFTDVAAEASIVAAKERDIRRRTNTAALKAWAKGDMGLLGENVALLGAVLGEVLGLVEEGGRVHQVLEMFEAWIAWVEAIYRGREARGASNIEFVDGLGEGWRGEVNVLIRKLQGLARQVDGLGGAEGGSSSSLGEMVEGVGQLTRGAAEELRAVEGLEREVVRREGKWVDEQVGRIGGEIDALLG